MSHWMNCATLFIIVAVVVMTAAHVVSPFQQKQPLLSIVPRTTYHLHIIPSSSSISTKSSSLSSTSSSPSPSFEGGFDVHQMDALEQRGKLEASFMEDLMMGVLGEEKNDANNNSIQKNKGKKKKKIKKKNKSPSAAIVARTLKQEGVVRLHKILSTATATALRQDILDRRDAAYASLSDTENNENNDEEWRKYFADVLLKGNKGQRCDLLLPLAQNPILQQALKEILISSTLLSSTLNIAQGGDDSTLYEMAALISEPGSSRQPIHPDNPFQDIVPLHTVFIALQDITTSMGPTYFIPRSHNNAKIHAAYNDVTPPANSSNNGNDRSGSGRDELLRNSSSRVALLPTGDAALFDSRILHCGGENNDSNEGGQTRVLLYLSFQNPRAKEPIGNVGSLLPTIQPTTIRELRTRLGTLISTTTTNMNMSGSNNKIGYSEDPFVNDNKDIGNVEEEKENTGMHKLSLSATQDNDALSQLELGISYYVGNGSNGIHTIDVLEAMKWFTLASNQGLAQAQYNLGCCYSDCVGVEFENGIDVNLNHSLEQFELATKQNYPGAKEARDELLNTL